MQAKKKKKEKQSSSTNVNNVSIFSIVTTVALFPTARVAGDFIIFNFHQDNRYCFVTVIRDMFINSVCHTQYKDFLISTVKNSFKIFFYLLKNFSYCLYVRWSLLKTMK